MATKKETTAKTVKTKKTTTTKKTTKKVEEVKEMQKPIEGSVKLTGTLDEINLAKAENIEGEYEMELSMVAQIYDKMITDYREYIKDMSPEELKAEEEVIIKKANDWDETIKNKVYKLSEKTTWQGHDITRTQVGAKIRAILDKFECEYKYTLGMYQMAYWWAAPKAEIEFAVLDNTLRVLGQPGIKYKGPKEWENILIIDQYFKECNAEYSRDTLRTYMWAGRHNAIIDLLQLNSPVTNKEVEEKQGEIEMVEE